MKTFLGLPILETADFRAVIKHILSVILFTGLAYFVLAIIAGGFSWKYVQSVEKHYVMQFLLLALAVLGGNLLRTSANKFGKFFFHLPKLDKYLYPIGFVVAYLVINEIFGM